MIQQTLPKLTLEQQYGPLAAAARALLESQEANDPQRALVNLEALKSLAVALDHPLEAGKGLLTLATIDKGRLLAEFNEELRRGGKMLKAGADGGEGKITLTVKLSRKGLGYTQIDGTIGLSGFKQERTSFAADAQLDDNGVLSLFDSKAAVDAIKGQPEKKTRKPSKAKLEAAAAEESAKVQPETGEPTKKPSQFEQIEAGADALSDGLAVGTPCTVYLRTDGESSGERLQGTVTARSTGKVWVTPEEGGEEQAFTIDQVEPRTVAVAA